MNNNPSVINFIKFVGCIAIVLTVIFTTRISEITSIYKASYNTNDSMSNLHVPQQFYEYDKEYIPQSEINDNYFKNASFVNRICTQKERKQHMQRICSVSRSKMVPSRGVRFLVDDEHKIAYCYIPKIASTTWKIIMMTSTKTGRKLAAPKGAHHPQTIRKRKLRVSGMTERIRGYTKFMITRNPIDRFQSAYFDKMYRAFDKRDSHFAYLRWARRTVLRSVNNGTSLGTPRVKFRDFVDFVLRRKGPPRLVGDKHWQRYASYCNPCNIRYDYIMKTETMTTDALYILPLLGRNSSALSKSAKNVIGAKVENSSTTSSIVGMKTLHILDDLSLSDKIKLKDRYKQEFMLFGYGFDTENNIINCRIRGENDTLCC